MIKASQLEVLFSMFEEKNLLKKLRLEHRLSQKELSNMAGISPSSLAKYETGKRQLSKDMDRILSEILGVETLLKRNIDSHLVIIDQLIIFKRKKGLTTSELANQVGIDRTLMSKILNHVRLPSKEVKQKIDIFLLTNGRDVFKDTIQTNGIISFPNIDSTGMGKRIQHIRKSRGETLENFGKEFTCLTKKNVISRWEKGINIPNIERLMNISYLGKVTVPYLLYGSIYRDILLEGENVSHFNPPNPINLGLRLRRIRKYLGLERVEFGTFFTPPISKWSMDRYENGKDIPNVNRIIQYAYLGDISLEFLIYEL